MSMNMRDSIRRFFAFLLATMMLFGQLPLDQVSFALGEEAPAAVEESVPEPEPAPAPEPEAPAPAPQEQAAEPEAPAPAPQEQAAEPEAPAPAPQEQAAEPEAPAPAPQEQAAEPEVTAAPARPEETAAPEATAEPAVTEQPEATEQPEETAAPEATEEPTATPEATEEPTTAPFSLSALTAGANKVQVGQKVSFSFQAEGAEQLSYQILLSGGEVASGAASDGQFAFTPAKSGAYTAVVTASRGEETLSESASFLAVDGDVSVSVSTSQLYGFASSKSIDFTASVSGGAAPYSLVWKVTANGSSMHESAQTLEQAGYAGFSYMPITSGDHTVTVLVRDAAGQTAEAAGSLPVAMKDRESRAEWERTVASVQLSGNWQNDLIAIARTQIGYAESKKDFEITDDGARHGWTRYGAWYGAEYGEWCAMFVSFCLNYAGIPESAVPRGASTSAWMNAMKGAGLFRLRSEGYKPAKGDIVFISTAKNGIADHVGMVERVGADVIETIEGNTPEAVVRRVRELDSYSIVGYASMEQAMKNARVWEQFHPATAQPDETAVPEATEAPATEQPEATEQPAETPAPEATEEPAVTEQPEATDIPATSTDLLPEEPSTMTDLPEIDPEIEVVVADAETGILVTFAHKALPEGVDADKVVLRVLPVAPDQLVALQAQMSEPNAETKAIAYDITLVNAATGEEFQPLHPVSVSMPVPADFDGELSLYHVADEAKAEPEQVEIEQAGDACVFEASSFSVYMLMNLKARDAEPEYKTMTLTLLPKGPSGTEEETAEIKEEWKKNNVSYGYEVVRTKNPALTNSDDSGWEYVGSNQDKYVNKDNDWKITWDKLPAKDSDGSEWFYCVRTWQPSTVPAPFVSNTGRRVPVKGGSWPDFVEVWTKPSTITVTAQIRWDDVSDQLKKRPENIDKVQLSYGNADDLRDAEIVKKEDGTYTATWKDVPVTYNGQSVTNHTITIPDLSKHYKTEVSGSWTSYTLTNKLNAKRIDMVLRFENSLNEDTFKKNDIEKPDKITATACVDGVPLQSEDAKHEFVMQKNGDQLHWYNQDYPLLLLQQQDDGTPIQLPEGEWSVQWSDEFKADKRFTVKDTDANGIKNARHTIAYEIYHFNNTGNVVYTDDENLLKLRPEKINLLATRNGTVMDGVTPHPLKTTEKTVYFSNWTSFAQKDKTGAPITYGVAAENLPPYYEVIAEPKETGSGNTYYKNMKMDLELKLKDPQTAKATVLWEGESIGTETELQNRPSTVNLALLYTDDDGQNWKPFWGLKEYTVTPNPEKPNEWTYEWKHLPSVSPAGKPVKYKVEQADKPAIYTTVTDEPVYTEQDGKVTSSEFKIHNSYNDNWNYHVDLQWDMPDPSEKYHIDRTTTSTNAIIAKYKLSMSVQKPYPIGALEVRVPYELFDRRNPTDTKGTVVNRVSLGDATQPSPNYNFTYRIDNKGTPDTSDDEIVFYNYKPLAASDNTTLTVEYEINPTLVVDCSVGKLEAKASGQYEGQPEKEAQTTAPITFRLDTGIQMTSEPTKKFWKNVYYWDERYGKQPDDFDMKAYNYVVYQLYTGYWYSNQIAEIRMEELPADGGEVVAVRRGGSDSPYGGDSYAVQTTVHPDTKAVQWTWDYYNKKDYYISGNSDYYYVIVRYPRQQYPDPEHEGQFTYETDYHNVAKINGVAVDQHPGDKEEGDRNDLIENTKEASAHWVDYVFHYTGEIYSGNKNLYGWPSAGITGLEYEKPQTAGFNMEMTVNGYEYENGFKMELTDDGVYASAYKGNSSTPKIRLIEEDFEFTDQPSIYVYYKGLDKLTGEELPGQISDKPFTVWGSTTVSGDNWQQLWQFTPTSSGNSNIMPEKLDGKGIVRLRVTSPDDLKDFVRIYVNSKITLLPTSPRLKEWIKDPSITYVYIYNIASMKYYLPTEDGEMRWANPWTDSSNSLSKEVGLDALDKAELGAYQYRRSDSESIGRVTLYSYLSKYADAPKYDVSNELVNVRFSIGATEYVNTTILPDEFYADLCHNEGVIYDLLPMGYSFDASKSVNAYGAFYYMTSSGSGSSYYAYFYGGNKQAAASVQTIDDYKGTGRQMVIFNMKSLEPEGKNWQVNSPDKKTGFGVQFWAKAGYNDVKSAETRYNIAAYQRKDKKPMSGSSAYTENGNPNSSSDYWKNPDDGTYLLYDVNRDGVVNEDKNTLYAYASVTPSLLLTIENGLSKRVRGYKGVYLLKDVVDLGNNYNYKLRLTTQKNGETSNVVIYDILENAANTEGHAGETQWKGTFVKADARQARAQGIKAVIWYSTQTGLSYNNEDNLLIEKKPSIWSQTPPTDLSKVTAVAYDLRLAQDGSEFKFSADSAIELEMTLKAPDELQPAEYTFNRPAYNSTFRPLVSTEATTSFNISNRTELSLRDLQEVEFFKQYEEAGALKPLGGIEFKLYRSKLADGQEPTGMPGNSASDWSAEPVAVSTSEANGRVAFNNLDNGTYAFVETSTRQGFVKPDHCYWVFTVDAMKGTVSKITAKSDSTSYQPIELTEKDSRVYLKNERYLKDLNIYKSWQDNSSAPVTRPTALTFDLYRNDVKIDTKTVQLTQTGSGYYLNKVFTNLYVYDEYGQPYTYKVKEHDVPYYTIDNANAELNFGTSNTGGTFTNRRMGVLDVKKVTVGTSTTRDFDFTVTLKKDNAALTEPTSFHARRFTTDQNIYTEEVLTLGAEGKLTFSLKGGETLRIIDLPRDIQWTAAEADNDYQTVVLNNANSGTTGYSHIPVAQFTNTPQPTTLQLPIRKAIDGQTPPTARQFQFTLTRVTQDAPLPGSASITLTGAQSGSFGAINYTKEGTYKYKLKETVGTVTGYQFDNSEYEVTVKVTDDNGKLKATWTAMKGTDAADELLFTNTYTPTPVTMKLPVNKNITGDPRPTEKTFTFNLTAVGTAPVPEDGTSLTITGVNTAYFGKMTFTKAGDYTYKLKEAEGTDTGYTYDTAERTIIVTVTDDNGTLKTSYKVNGTPSTTGATFTNQYKPTATALEIPVKKLITGNDTPADKTFTFTIAASGSAPVPANLSTTVTGASTGKFGAISFTEAGVYNYTVRETNGGEPGYTYDTTAHAVQVTVKDTDGVLSASFKVDTATETHVTFTNTYKPKAATLVLPVKKALEGNTTPTNKIFTFQLKTTDSAPMPTPATAKVTGAGESAFSAITFTKAGKYHYELTEENSGEAGYQYDNKTYSVEVTVTDTNGTLSAEWAATLGGEDATELLFTNRYEPTATTVQIPVKKILAGNTTPSVKTFSFTLEAVTADAPMPDTATVSVNGAGQVSFGVMSYSKAATYTYKLKENGGSEPGYQYDGTTHNITVTVKDVAGVLQAAWQMDGTTVDAVPFTNTYTPASVKVKLPVTKKLTGSETPENKVFTFNLATTNSAPMPASATTTVTGAGSGEFGEINFTAAGDYRYTVTETDSHEPGYEYDASTRNVLVKVTDTNGVLSADVKVDGRVNAEGAVFTNKYTPASATLEIPVRKKITGNQTPADKNFTFRITAITAGAPMPGATLLSVTGASMAKFREIKFTKAGEYQYKIAETQGHEPGYTYDHDEHTVTVMVKDTNGTLGVTYKVDDTDVSEVVFTNGYEPATTKVVLPVKKIVKGNARPADEKQDFVFTLAAVTANAPMPDEATVTINDEGEASFGEINYSVAGEYKYTLRETHGGAPGYDYDTDVRNITVTVKDTNGRLSAAWKADDETVAKIQFTNTYTPTPVDVTLPVRKNITGKARPAGEEEEFTFTLKAVTSGAPMPDNPVVKITDEGTRSFGAIRYTKAGVFTYTLTEKQGAKPGYGYDTAPRRIAVTVTDTNGVLSASWTVNSEEKDDVLFTNTYNPAAITVTLPVKKEIEGNNRPNGGKKTFTFKLEALSEGAPMPATDEITITDAGQASFSAISYDSAGDYVYKLTEIDGQEHGYSYDLTERDITVSVKDTAGKLSATWTVNGQTQTPVLFKNRYTPDPVSLVVPVKKAITGNERPAGQEATFTFTLAAASAGAPLPNPATVTITDEGDASFAPITFTAAGRYNYTLTETDAAVGGYTYDKVPRQLAATVTDTDGVLSVRWTVNNLEKDEVLFTNTYTPTPAALVLPVRKVITGNPRPESAKQTFTFTLAAVTAGAPMPSPATVTIRDEGTANFANIAYTKAGEYTYTLKETEGSAAGYRYDTDAREVTVTVTDTNGVLNAEWAVTGKTDPEATFTNHYEPATGTIVIPVRKKITGNARPDAEKQEFVFTLAAVTPGAPMPNPAVVTITDEGTASFEAISFAEAKVYEYTLTESDLGVHGYQYDTIARNIKVTVTDNGGALQAVWTANDASVTEVLFTNDYTTTPVELQLPVEKRIEPITPPTEKVFAFTLTAEGGAPMPANAVGGTATLNITGAHQGMFDAIKFTKAGVYTYKVQEVDGGETGYTYDPTVHTVTVTVTDHNGQLDAEWTIGASTPTHVVFTNQYLPNGVTLQLPVSKSFTGHNRPEEKTFTFEIAAVTPGAPMPAANTATVTGVGSAKFRAISYTAIGVWTYRVTEKDTHEDGYTYDPKVYTVTVSVTDENGTLKAVWENDQHVVGDMPFVNGYTPAPVKLIVPIQKELQGNPTPTDKTFTFTMNAVTAGAPLPASVTASVTGAGTVNFGEIEFDTAGTYIYEVKEEDGGEHGYAYDNTKHKVTVTVEDQNGHLAATYMVDDQEPTDIIFTNTYTPTPAALALPVRKVITGNPRPESAKQNFVFTLAAVTAGAPMPSPATVTIRDEGTANFANIAYTKAGEYTYTLKETEGSAAGYQYDTAAREVKVKVTDTNGVLSAAWEVTGKTDPEATFTNHYEPAKSEVVIPVRKKITGHSRPTGEEQTFTFTLAAVTPGAPMPNPAVVTITDEGTASFEAISFAEAKVYEYTLTETDGGVNGYQYDTAVRAIKVTVTDNGGALQAVWTANDASVTEVLFTNDYTPTPVELQLPVEKRIEPITPPTEKVFAFTLTAEGGAPMPANAVGGTATLNITGAHQGMFDAIKFTKAGVYTYKVQEVDGGETGYTYDPTVHTVTVTVTDHNGQLDAEWTIGAATPTHVVFTNRYRPQGVLLQLPVSKSFTGNARPTEKKFIFEIAAVTPGAPMPDSLITEITGAGSAKFGAINYTEIGQWQYTVTERNTHEAGYTYANTTYTVTVRVTDVNGKLQAAWENDQHIADDMPFVNNYTPAPVALELPVVKQLTGNPTPSDKTFTFTLSAVTAGAPMPASAQASVTGAGTATFGAMTYTAAGEYIYSLKEENGGETGYTYDNKTHRIKVKVTDIGGSLKVNYAVDNAPMNDEMTPPSFTNQYAPIPVKVTVPVTKLLTGQPTPSAKNFVFKLTALTANAPMPEGNGAKATSVGASTVNFGELTFTAAGDYSYLVEEIEGHDAGYAYDQAKHRVEVRVTDNNGRLSATWTSDGATVGSVEFTNVYTPEKAAVSFPVRKMIPGDPTPNNKNFLFTLTAVGAAPMPDNAVSGVSTLTIAGAGASAFGIITYEEAGTFRYKVKETNSGATGYTYDTTEYDVTVTVTDHQGVLKATWSSPQGNELVFKNPYAPIPVDVVFPVRKTVEEVSPVPSPENFVFELVAATAGAPMPAGSSVTISGSGTAAFGSIHYLHAGVYEYRLTERDDHAPGYKYDTKARRIKVVVTDNDGTLEAVWTINGKTATEAEFVNKYEPEPVELPLMAKKIMKGRRLKANMFMFVLKDDAGNILQTVGNAKNGDIVFEPLRYTKPGVHTYKVSEVQGSRFGTTYDTTVHTFTVTVTDVGGKLKAEMNIPMENLKWTNTFKAKVPYTGDGANTHPWLYAMGAMAMMTLILAIMGQKRRRASK